MIKSSVLDGKLFMSFILDRWFFQGQEEDQGFENCFEKEPVDDVKSYFVTFQHMYFDFCLYSLRRSQRHLRGKSV